MNFYYDEMVSRHVVPDSVCLASIVKMRYAKNLCDSRKRHLG